MPKVVINLRLVSWVDNVDFRASERTNWKRLGPEYKAHTSDDTVLLISKSRKMGAFVWGSGYRSDGFFCIRFWCPNGFNWTMLQDYAREAGIELRGMRSFTDHFARRYAPQVVARMLQ